MKNDEASGMNIITLDLLQSETDTTLDVLHTLLEEETLPEDWEGYKAFTLTSGEGNLHLRI